MEITAIAGVSISQIKEQLGEKAVTAIVNGNPYSLNGYLYFDFYKFECYWGIDTDPVLLGICGDREFTDFESFESELIGGFNVSKEEEVIGRLFLQDLKPREHDVFALLTEGLKVVEIAKKLRVSTGTIYYCISKLLDKANVKNSKELIATYKKHLGESCLS